MLQSSSGRKLKKCETTLLFIAMHYRGYTSLEVKGRWRLLLPPCLLIIVVQQPGTSSPPSRLKCTSTGVTGSPVSHLRLGTSCWRCDGCCITLSGVGSSRVVALASGCYFHSVREDNHSDSKLSYDHPSLSQLYFVLMAYTMVLRWCKAVSHLIRSLVQKFCWGFHMQTL